MQYDYNMFSTERATLGRNHAHLLGKIRNISNDVVRRNLGRLNAAIEALKGANPENDQSQQKSILMSLEAMRVSLEAIISEIKMRANIKFYLKVVNGIIISLGGSEKSHLGELFDDLRNQSINLTKICFDIKLSTKIPKSGERINRLYDLEVELEKRHLGSIELEKLKSDLRYFKHIARGLLGVINGINAIKGPSNRALRTIIKIERLMPKR